MPDANNIVLFLIATVTLNLTPGPDMMYVVARSLGQGRAAGIVSSFGIAAGCVVHTLAVGFGLVTVIMAVPAAYQVIKYAGAAYLIFLGVRVVTGRDSERADTPTKRESLHVIFFQGMLTNLLNPKVALFFLAFLPQFVNKASPALALQIIVLGLMFNVSGTIVNVLVALGASFTGERFRAQLRNSSLFRWVTGSIFIGLGLRLAFMERR